MSLPPAPQDPGLARERTVLAWQRTALALAGATIVIGRLTFDSAGYAALLLVFLGLVHTAVIFRTARRHYRARAGLASVAGWPTGVHGVLLSLQVTALGVLELVDLSRS